MNESLAKQLHDLISATKINIADHTSTAIQHTFQEMETLENNVNKLIEKQNTKSVTNDK
jgi:hypothetical protein